MNYITKQQMYNVGKKAKVVQKEGCNIDRNDSIVVVREQLRRELGLLEGNQKENNHCSDVLSKKQMCIKVKPMIKNRLYGYANIEKFDQSMLGPGCH